MDRIYGLCGVKLFQPLTSLSFSWDRMMREALGLDIVLPPGQLGSDKTLISSGKKKKKKVKKIRIEHSGYTLKCLLFPSPSRRTKRFSLIFTVRTS